MFNNLLVCLGRLARSFPCANVLADRPSCPTAAQKIRCPVGRRREGPEGSTMEADCVLEESIVALIACVMIVMVFATARYHCSVRGKIGNQIPQASETAVHQAQAGCTPTSSGNHAVRGGNDDDASGRVAG